MTNKKTIYKIVTDVVVAVGTVLLLSAKATGETLHEWIGVAALAAILTHLLLSFDWFAAATRRFFQKQTFQVHLNWILSLALFIAMTAAFYSGLVISKMVMPALGIELADGMSWKSIHTIASDFTLYLVGLHLALNWKWVVKHIFAPFRRQPPQAAENHATAVPVRRRDKEQYHTKYIQNRRPHSDHFYRGRNHHRRSLRADLLHGQRGPDTASSLRPKFGDGNARPASGRRREGRQRPGPAGDRREHRRHWSDRYHLLVRPKVG